MNSTLPHAAAFVATLAALVAPATSQVEAPPSFTTPYTVDTGWVEIQGVAGDDLKLVESFQVIQAGADWLRVSFDEVILAGDPLAGNGAELRIYSGKDGALQIMNAFEVERWAQTSAYFNGDTVQVEVWAQPGTGTSRVVVDEIEVGVPPAYEARSICGSLDDRNPSSDPRSGRLLPIGCTGWLIQDCAGCFLTAGHCTGNIQVVEFNVPPSLSNGTIQHPGPEDQYPVDQSSIQSNGGQGVGNDWAYFGTFSNGTTNLTVTQAQGPGFELSSPPAVGNATIRITGYGTTSPRDQENQVQQTHTGALVTSTTTTVQYTADTTGGNSGSPVIWDQTGMAVGIHTHGGCSASGGQNSGTSFDRAELQNALAAPRGICASGVSLLTAPTVVPRGMATSVSASVLGGVVPGSVTLHYRASAGAGFAQILMNDVGSGNFAGDLPGFDCGDEPAYFISAQTTTCGQVFAPVGGASSPILVTVGDEVTAFADDFQSDLGWTTSIQGASSGAWQRGVPVNDGGWAYDPASDGDGSGSAYLTQNQNGNTDVDGGSVTLTSPVLTPGAGDAFLSFLYYLEMTSTGAEDALVVEVLPSGGAWTQVRRLDQNTGGGWDVEVISAAELVAAGVPSGGTFQVRFTANDADGQSIVEAGVDGVRAGVFSCDGSAVGSVYCQPANINSTGFPSEISGSGSASLSANDLVITVSTLPANMFGFVVLSTTQGFTPNVGGSNGNLCIAGALGRDFTSIQTTGAMGVATHAVDWMVLPQPTGPVAAMAGDVWNFQFWHRDTILGIATSNLSPGLSVTVQ